MITKRNGKTLIHMAGLIGSSFLSSGLQAQDVSPSSITGHCNYGDCAIFHECTDHHDRENLRELNSKGIIAQAILAPLPNQCAPYSDCESSEPARESAKCERSKKLAQLVLAAREL